MRNYREKARDIIANADVYHAAYYKAETFSGPSLYFHRRALSTRFPPGDKIHLEYIYATLASWGMHRMGKGGSKMQDFSVFSRSIGLLLPKIAEVQQYDLREMKDDNWAVIKEIFQRIRVMASATSLVGNSKIMHHMMPNMVPPIDRQYTLTYLHGNTNIKNDLEYEWQVMKDIIAEFFVPVVLNDQFSNRAETWISKKDDSFPWDTSPLKVVDNLIIGSRKISELPI
jgi:hypothetical protein